MEGPKVPRLDEYEGYVLHLLLVPVERDESGEVRFLDLVVYYTQGTLVTVRRERWPALDAIWDRVAADPGRELGRGAQVVYHEIAERLVDAYLPMVDEVEDAADELERQVLQTVVRLETLGELFRLRRMARHMLRVARNQREGVARLAAGHLTSLRKETCYLFRDVHDRLLAIHDVLDDHRETLGGLRDTYVGVVSNRMNQVMKTLTIFSAILLPLTFLTGLWGMNFEVLPLSGEPLGFWIFLGGCGLLASGGLTIIWRKGWLRRVP